MAEGTGTPSEPEENPESPLERVEEAVRDTAGEAEIAAWETVYEVRDLAEDAVEKITGHDYRSEEG